MMEHSLCKVKLTILKALPAVITAIFVILSIFPERMILSGQWIPHWVMITLYFCALFRRGAFPLWLAFTFGLVQDSLTGMPLGSTSFVYTTFFIAIMFRRRYLVQRSFNAVWLWFTLLLLMATFIQWSVLSLYNMTALPIHDGIAQWFSTICIYPLSHIILNKWLSAAISLQTKEHISRNYVHRHHH